MIMMFFDVFKLKKVVAPLGLAASSHIRARAHLNQGVAFRNKNKQVNSDLQKMQSEMISKLYNVTLSIILQVLRVISQVFVL